MSGVLRLSNTGVGTGRSTIISEATDDQTYILPVNGGVLITGGSSSELVFPSGTEALPGLQVQGDPDTGLYAPAANTLAISTGGAERLRMDSSGNVGIGTDNPGFPLTVAAASQNIAVRTAANAAAGYIGVDGDGFGLEAGYNNNGFITFKTIDGGSSLERMRIDNSGNVGIGTNSPNKTLEVKASANPIMRIGDGTRHFEILGGSTTQTAGIGTAYNSSFTFNIDSTERMRLDSLGNFGIGTNSPNVRLEVTGDSAVTQSANIYASSNNPVQLALTNGFGARQGLVYGNSGSTGYTSFGIISENTALTFKTAAYNIGNTSDLTTGWTESMRLDNSGRLLIGHTSTTNTAPLQVTTSDTGAWTAQFRTRTTNDYAFLGFTDYGGTEDLAQIGVQRTAADNGELLFYTNNGAANGSERMRISSTGVIVLPNGSPGIQFGTTSTNNGSGVLGSRTLDDYEEGTWTPTIAAQDGTFSINFTTRTGYYTKTGNIVTAYFNVSWNSFSNGTGNIMYIGTLPYLALSAAQVNGYITQIYGVDFISWGGVTGGTSLSLQGYSGTRITTCAMKSGSTVTDTRGRMSMLNATGTIRGTVIYNVS